MEKSLFSTWILPNQNQTQYCADLAAEPNGVGPSHKTTRDLGLRNWERDFVPNWRYLGYRATRLVMLE